MSFTLHDFFKFKGVECSLPEYSIFSKGSKFIQKQIIYTCKNSGHIITAESLTYLNFHANNPQYSTNLLNQRISKNQPISAPNDVKRYFVTPQESGELCLMSGLLGENK